jgi:hypothetical protein
MATRGFSCEALALPELIARLEELRTDEDAPLAVALLGDNNNLLGIGQFSATTPPEAAIGEGTVRLTLIRTGILDIDFTVNLCCVCSIISADTLDVLQDLLSDLGVFPIPGTGNGGIIPTP